MYTPEQLEALLDKDCNCITRFSPQMWEYLVLNGLANIEASLDGLNVSLGGTTPVTWLPLEVHGFASFDGTYKEVLADSNEKEYVSITNYTNEPILFSRDGLVAHGVVGPNGSSLTLNLGSNGKTEAGSIWIRELLTTPTDGSVYISAYY